jgi:hypothetical protein
MPRQSKSTRVIPVETFRGSHQVLDAINRFTEMYHRCESVTRCVVSYNRGPWKLFSIRFASWK